MATSETPVFMVRAETHQGLSDVFTLVPPAVIATSGLASHAIIGSLSRPLAPGEFVTPASFARNFLFVEFFHEFLAKTAWKEPACRAAAERMGEGWVYIVDQRTPTPGGAVPPEDIVGGFQVQAGKVAPGSYRRNPNHLILSDRGFFRLGPWLHPRLVDAMSRALPDS
jgi:hypothetical protein